MPRQLRSSIKLFLIPACVAVACSAWVSAQTKITAPKNKFSLQVDVQEGAKGAAAIEKQLPIFGDEVVTAYVQGVGAGLVAKIPPEFQHPEFKYVFKVVDIKDINAFALPGGPMYVHRGIIEASKTEGELAGVMAHEVVHVALRHGTAQVTAQQSGKFRLGALAGIIAGTVVGGGLGDVIIQGTSLGLNGAFLRFSRDYEKQADLLGVQMMARAGYDPRDLAHMFETISKEGGGKDPQWLSDHPNPGNRVAYINEEASHVTIEKPVGANQPAPPSSAASPEGIILPSTGRSNGASGRTGFVGIQERLKSFPPAPTMAELAKQAQERQQQQQRGR
ncbi:MAG: M48 family metallopeptidase [Vicinamibacterales bacterium]